MARDLGVMILDLKHSSAQADIRRRFLLWGRIIGTAIGLAMFSTSFGQRRKTRGSTLDYGLIR